MDNAELPRLTSIHKWRDLWELHHTRQQDEFLAKVDNLSALSANLDDGAYLLFELSKYPTSYPTNKSNEFTRAESALIALKNADWFIPPYEVEFDKFSSFNRGAFGKVYHGKWKRSQIVVKKVKLRNEEDQAAFFNEVEIWHKLYHPHVVQLFGACNIGKPFFVCEYAGCGQLDNYLRDHPDELWGKFFGSTVPTREAFIHEDLKCNNILVGNDGYAKLTDFGLSRLKSTKKGC
ncbi:Serine/threonine protein kinase [Phytophthora megakarya]|uniref:Serine/threonine protein kinase n=1 Tax=Phytophthora megakarya TaxID=4795 RepID=A0A225UHU6_9STRA|nr:Serine/threonine protein kinase [Phytophthora megakarya]